MYGFSRLSLYLLCGAFLVMPILCAALYCIDSYPKEGAYCDGMFLDGAGWNRQDGCLEEPPPMELFYQMPVIHFKVRQKSSFGKRIGVLRKDRE